MTTAATATTTATGRIPARPVRRRSRPVPRGEVVKVLLALVLNAILFGVVLF